MKPLSPAGKQLFALVRSEPEWAHQALLDYFERVRAGDKSEESVKRWRDERAEAEAAHLAV